MRYLIIALVGMVLVPIGAFAAIQEGDRLTGQHSIGSDLPRSAIGQTVSRDGISVVLRDVAYSSSTTILTLVVTDDSLTEQERGTPAERISPVLDMHVEGMANEANPQVSIQSTGPGESTVTATLGAVVSADEPVDLVIDSIRLLKTGYSNAPVEGPWVFEFVPGPSAVDSTDLTINSGKSVSDNDTEIELRSVHVSSSDVRVRYHLTTNKKGFLGRSDWAARMVFADGTWVGGNASQPDPSKVDGDLEAIFPPLPKGMTAFRIEFGPLMESVAGPFEFSFPLPRGRQEGTSSRIDSTVEIAGEAILVEGVTFQKDATVIVLRDVADGPRTLVPDTRVKASITDDSGKAYHVQGFTGVAPVKDNKTGEIEAGSIAIQLDPISPDAQSLTVSVPVWLGSSMGPGRSMWIWLTRDERKHYSAGTFFPQC